MSKFVRLNDDVYVELDKVRGKRETFSQAVYRLLIIWGYLYHATTLHSKLPPVVLDALAGPISAQEVPHGPSQ